MTRAGFDFERGQADNNKHIPIEQLKTITNYEMQQFEKQTVQYEKEINTNNINELKAEYKRVIKKFNTLANQYTKIKTTNDNTLIKVQNIQRNYEFLKEDVYKLHRSNKWLKHCLNKTFECVSIMFDFPIDRLKSIINRYIKGNKNDERNNRK